MSLARSARLGREGGGIQSILEGTPRAGPVPGSAILQEQGMRVLTDNLGTAEGSGGRRHGLGRRGERNPSSGALRLRPDPSQRLDRRVPAAAEKIM